MVFGITLTALTFTLLIVSIVAYYLYYLRNEEQVLKIARMAFYGASAFILMQSVLLMYGILNHYFEWIYVFQYSSRSLSLYYLVSTFWAGQEGTFLLWLIYGSLYGIFIIRTQKKDEPLVMTFMALIQGFITLILIKRNPFSYVWDINPGGFQAGMIPADGNGLNPLLQDPYMVIHPPILFAGYSSTMILFSFAMAALIRKKHDDWIKTAYPFSVFVALTLGTGITLGGYWAYTTLGWGGYWGWDPVENSSLVPWLTSLALFHGIIIQRRKGGMKRLNVLLALLTFIFVLYGSFLTRSGILTDFSVHSFGESELSTYLFAFLFLFTGVGIMTFLFRANGVKGEEISSGFFTRELFMSYGMMLLLLLMAFTFLGTSWPLITSIFSDKPQSIELAWYNKVAAPITIIIGILIAVAPVLSWKRDNIKKLKDISVHAIISLLLSSVVFALGVRSVIPLLVICVAFFILLVNGQIVYQMVRQKTYAFGGYLAHVGIGFMLIGIITSSVYDISQRITLPLNKDVQVLGYTVKYTGQEKAANGKDKVNLVINQDHKSFARFYYSEFNNSYMISPSIVNNLLEDLYISPIQILGRENEANMEKIEISKGGKQRYDDISFHFIDYEMNNHQAGGENLEIFARIEILDNYGKVKSLIKPGIKIEGKKQVPLPASIPNSSNRVFIDGLSVEQGTLVLAIENPNHNHNENTEQLAAEISTKPLINILWLGTIILVSGLATTIYNRSLKQKL